MGAQDVQIERDAEKLRAFTKLILNDVRALEHMLTNGCIETGVRRIGVEQEMFLVDRHWRPAPIVDQILKEINDDHFTPELARFNLECNSDPLIFTGRCFSQLEDQLNEMLAKARTAAQRHNAHIILTGILPTLTKSDLGLESMTPRPRYFAINEALTRLRGRDYEFYIKGIDELHIKHESVMLESCNTSFQAHFQVGPDEFANLYNIAMVATGPVLAISGNSPLLFGKRLWRETRIALFQQAVDTRNSQTHMRDLTPRVSFGSDWVNNGVLDIFQEDVARFRTLLSGEVDEDPFAVLARGQSPQLTALRMHNSTVYRWNRPCYGVGPDGTAHLRIENRVLPAGPSVADEVANAALWFGIMSGLSLQYDDIRKHMRFEDVYGNFMAAATHGIAAQFSWLNGAEFSARDLLIDVLIPLAQEGLAARDVEKDDIERNLEIIRARAESGRTGSHWHLASLAGMKEHSTKGEWLSALTAATLARQQTGEPVHTWELATLEEAGGWQSNYQRVEQFMATDLFTVNAEELVDLVAAVMDWRHVRHVPVEDDDHHLVGIVSHRSLLRLLARGAPGEGDRSLPVSQIMNPNPITVMPSTTTLEAIQLMATEKVGCLPVVDDGKLVGIITEFDFLHVARELLEHQLRDTDE